MRRNLFAPTSAQLIAQLDEYLAQTFNDTPGSLLSNKICTLLKHLESVTDLNDGHLAQLRNLVTNLIVHTRAQRYSLNYFENYFQRHVENTGENIPHPYLGDLATFADEAHQQWAALHPGNRMGMNITLGLIRSHVAPHNMTNSLRPTL